MKTRIFDVAVLGDGVGGLIAALLLQKRHAKIAVLRKRDSSKALPYICEFLNGFSLKPALKRVGFHPTEVNSIPNLEVPIQLVFSDHRIDCYGDESRFIKELEREYPKESKQILQLFRNGTGHLEIYQHLFNSRVPLPPQGFFAKRQFKKVLEQVCDVKLLESRKLEKELKTYVINGDFGRAIEALQLCFTQLKSTWTCGAQLGHLLSLSRWDGYWAPEGVMTIQKLLVEKIKERGGVIIDFEKFKEMEATGKTLSRIALENSEFDQISARAVIIAGDPHGFLLAAPDLKLARNWSDELSELPCSLQKVYQAYQVASIGLPMGMRSQGIIIPPGPPSGMEERRSHIRAIRYVIRKQENGAGQKETVIGLCGFISAKMSPVKDEVIEKEIRESIRSVVPFLDHHLLAEPTKLFVPSRERKAGDFWQSNIYESEKPRELGVMGFTPETPFDNVFLASDLNFPGLGLDGEIIGGIQAGYFAGNVIGKDRALSD